MTEAEAVGRRLQEAREQVGLSQEAAAARLGMHEVTLSNIERGKRARPPGGDVLAEAARIYGVSVASLLGRGDDRLSDVARETIREGARREGRAEVILRVRELLDKIEAEHLPEPSARRRRDVIATAKSAKKRSTG